MATETKITKQKFLLPFPNQELKMIQRRTTLAQQVLYLRTQWAPEFLLQVIRAYIIHTVHRVL